MQRHTSTASSTAALLCLGCFATGTSYCRTCIWRPKSVKHHCVTVEFLRFGRDHQYEILAWDIQRSVFEATNLSFYQPEELFVDPARGHRMTEWSSALPDLLASVSESNRLHGLFDSMPCAHQSERKGLHPIKVRKNERGRYHCRHLSVY